MSSEEEKAMTCSNDDPDYQRGANVRWVVVGVEVPPIIGRGWEGIASAGGLGARGLLRQTGRRRGRLHRQAVRWSVMAADS